MADPSSIPSAEALIQRNRALLALAAQVRVEARLMITRTTERRNNIAAVAGKSRPPPEPVPPV